MRVRRVAVVIVLLLGTSLALRGDGPFTPREERLGKQLICMCGCQQGVLVCTTLNCSVKLPMQAELRQRAATNASDSLILQSFVQEYGTAVIANPTHVGFNESAWVVPWVILGLGLVLVLYFVRRFRGQHAAPAGPAAAPSGEEESIRKEVAAEMEKEW